MSNFEYNKNGCFEFPLHPQNNNALFPVKVYAMNVEGVVKPLNRNDTEEGMVIQSMVEESRISDRNWLNYRDEYCNIYGNLLDYLSGKNNGNKKIMHIASVSTIGDHSDKPKLTCLTMPSEYRHNCGGLLWHNTKMYIECPWIKWEEAWELKKMDKYDYNHYRVDLSQSDFILAAGKETLDSLRLAVDKLTHAIKSPFVKSTDVINSIRKTELVRQMLPDPKLEYGQDYLRKKQEVERLREEALKSFEMQRYDWRMIRGGGRIPRIVVLCSSIVLEQKLYNDILGNSITRKGFIASMKCQLERQDKRHKEQAKAMRIKMDEESRRKQQERIRQYNITNAHSRDCRIRINESNNACIVDNHPFDNVRFAIRSLFPQFNVLKHVQESSLIKGKAADVIQKEWKEKSQKTMDSERLFLEQVEQFHQGKSISQNTSITQYINFSKHLNIIPYRTGWYIFDEGSKMAGRVDLICESSGLFTIYKLTTRSHIVEHGVAIKINEDGKYAFAPISHIPDTLYYQFALELALNKYILEKNYNLKISELRLGVFNELQANSSVYYSPIFDRLVRLLLMDYCSLFVSFDGAKVRHFCKLS